MIDKGNWYSYELGKIGLDGNIEFDYDKLASAIIKLKGTEPEPILEKESQQVPKLTIGLFFKTLIKMIFGKIETNSEMTVGVFSILLATFFRVLALVGFVSLGYIGYIYVHFLTTNNLLSSFLGWTIVCVPLMFGCLIFSAFLWGASNEVMKERDRNFIIAVFSGVVAFVALVVSFLQYIGDIVWVKS